MYIDGYSKIVLKKAFYAVSFLIMLSSLQAANYYVSTAGNDSTGDGSFDNPWQTIQTGVKNIGPGDTLFIRGGVYHEEISMSSNLSGGTKDNPVFIKNYAEETPILDGATMLSGWEKAASAGQVHNNPNWQKLYILYLSSETPREDDLLLLENEEYLVIASTPDITTIIPENVMEYQPVKEETYNQTDYLIDSENLTQTNDYWNGAKINIWSHSANNLILERNVSDFDGDQHKIIFDETINPLGEGSNPDAYRIYNHPGCLDSPGEYYYEYDGEYKRYKIVLWPKNKENITQNIKLSDLSTGIYFSRPNCNYVTIEGLHIKNYSNGDGGISCKNWKTHTNVTVKKCVVHNIFGSAGIELSGGTHDIIRNCTISNVAGGFGITLSKAQYGLVEGNSIRKTERTSIYLSTSENCIISKNIAKETGNHGNGISAYLGSKDILIAHNQVFSSYFALTANNSTNIFVFSNFLGTSDSVAVKNHSEVYGDFSFINNTILGTNSISFYLTEYGDYTPYVANNIIHGAIGLPESQYRHNNLYTNLSYQQNRSDWFPVNGEAVNTECTLSMDFEKGEFAFSPTETVKGKGSDISDHLPTEIFPGYDFSVDMNGNPWAPTPSIGTYEYSQNSGQNEEPKEQVLVFKADFNNTSQDTHYDLLNMSDYNYTWLESSILMDGQDDAVCFISADASTLYGTVSLWIYPTNIDGTRYLFGHCTNDSSNPLYLYTKDGQLGLQIGDRTTENMATLTPNEWVNVILSWNSPDYNLYINGCHVACDTYSEFNEFASVAYIGNKDDQSISGFQGAVDEARLYAMAITDDQAWELYNSFTMNTTQAINIQLPLLDKQGNSVSYTAQVIGLPLRALFDLATQTFTWHPWHDQTGTYEILFQTESGQQKMTIDVEDVPKTDWYSEWLNNENTKTAIIEY